MGEIEKLKNAELAVIVNSQPHNIDEREVAYLKINALQSVIAHFESIDRKSTRLNSSHVSESRMPSSA